MNTDTETKIPLRPFASELAAALGAGWTVKPPPEDANEYDLRSEWYVTLLGPEGAELGVSSNYQDERTGRVCVIPGWPRKAGSPTDTFVPSRYEAGQVDTVRASMALGAERLARRLRRDFFPTEMKPTPRPTRFECPVCGKLTAGRLPRDSSGRSGDTTVRFPRRHKWEGRPCPGNIQEAIWR